LAVRGPRQSEILGSPHKVPWQPEVAGREKTSLVYSQPIHHATKAARPTTAASSNNGMTNSTTMRSNALFSGITVAVP
jgi:hypothetical protein